MCNWRIFSLFICFGVLFILFYVFQVGNATTEQWMDTHVRHAGIRGILLYIGVVTVVTAVGIPRQLCSLLGGYVFGLWWGTLWATVGTSFACILCFSYARFLGQTWLQKRYRKKLIILNDFLCQSPFLLTFIVRIVPLGSNFLTNFLAGISLIPARSFFAGSVLGFSVQNFIFAMLGSGLQLHTQTHMLYSTVLYIISLSLAYWVYRHYKKHRKGRVVIQKEGKYKKFS